MNRPVVRDAAPTEVRDAPVLRLEPTLRATPPSRRGVRLTGKPRVSVVLASQLDRQRLAECLEVLVPYCAMLDIELLVSRCATKVEAASLTTTYPTVLFVFPPRGSPLSVLRSAGLTAAHGDVVTFLSDADIVDPERISELVRTWYGPMA